MVRLEQRDDQLAFTVVSGRGLLLSDDRGASIEVGGHRVSVREGTIFFNAAAQPVAELVTGEQAELDGQALVRSPSTAESSDLLAPGWCAPPRPELVIPIGSPVELVEAVEGAHSETPEGEQDDATAEGGATCVDSADTGAASDPTTGEGVTVDPDVRRDDVGRLTITIHVPRRSR
jgi:hypothetical protein